MMPHSEVTARDDIMQFFADKYGDAVRVEPRLAHLLQRRQPVLDRRDVVLWAFFNGSYV